MGRQIDGDVPGTGRCSLNDLWFDDGDENTGMIGFKVKSDMMGSTHKVTEYPFSVPGFIFGAGSLGVLKTGLMAEMNRGYTAHGTGQRRDEIKIVDHQIVIEHRQRFRITNNLCWFYPPKHLPITQSALVVIKQADALAPMPNRTFKGQVAIGAAQENIHLAI